MKQLLVVIFFIVYGLDLTSCSVNDSDAENSTLPDFSDTTLVSLIEENTPNLTIKEGIVCTKEQTMRIMRKNECIAVIKLGKPQIVSQAVREEAWGYFQFPVIYRAEGSRALIVKWAMQDDSPAAYGQNAGDRLMSYDEGVTWVPLDNDYYEKKRSRVELSNGSILQVKNPSSKMVSSYEWFPSPVNERPIGKSNYDFYLEQNLPEELQGVYFSLYNTSSKTESVFHANLYDPGLLRYSINGLMPIVWSGYIKELQDGSLVASVYGGFYKSSLGKILRTGISFYKSIDMGHNWSILGKIPYHGLKENDETTNPFDGKNGFSEPSFEILKDGTYICVMRNENWNVPMCKSYSNDNGKTWSIPKPFTPNGVKPRIILMDNGTMVLISGRPGIQLRVCVDGDGDIWSEPIDMLPFIDEEGKYDSTRETCGYADLLQVDDHTLYLVYSDFLTKNERNEIRKSIVFRKVEIFRR